MWTTPSEAVSVNRWQLLQLWSMVSGKHLNTGHPHTRGQMNGGIVDFPTCTATNPHLFGRFNFQRLAQRYAAQLGYLKHAHMRPGPASLDVAHLAHARNGLREVAKVQKHFKVKAVFAAMFAEALKNAF